MSFDINKEISIISKDIKDEEKQLEKLNSVYNQIPKNIINKHNKKDKDSKNNYHSLNNALDIITKIDKIKEESNPIKKLYLLKSLFLTNTISNPYLKQIIITQLINEDIIKSIEDSLLNINYPMFQGKILMTLFEQIITKNKIDLEILSLYLEIYSYIVNDIYKEFPNYGNINKLALDNKKSINNKFYFIEMIPEFLYKKTVATIFYNKNKNNNKIQNQNDIPTYLKKLSSNERNILFEYEKLISYLNKSISNTSELFSLIINKANEDNKNENKDFQFNKITTLKYIINSLLDKLILFLTSEKSPLDISNCTIFLKIILIQKTNEQANEFIKNYKYDSFKNISLYDYIKYYINDNSEELKKRQKEFNDNIISKLKESISTEKDSKSFRSEDLLDSISMLITDIFSIYETFRTYEIIDQLLMPSLKDILLIFKNYYESQINFGFEQNNLTIGQSLFLINILSHYLNICTKEFDFFLERVNIFEKSVIDKMTDTFSSFKNEVSELFKDFIAYTLPRITFDKIVLLYDYNSLKKGNNSEDIKKSFTEENDFWMNIKEICGKIKVDRKIYMYMETEVLKYFMDSVNKKISYNIEKGDIKGKNLDDLIDNTKFFIENNFFSEENEINEEINKKIQDLYLNLANLSMNKK